MKHRLSFKNIKIKKIKKKLFTTISLYFLTLFPSLLFFFGFAEYIFGGFVHMVPWRRSLWCFDFNPWIWCSTASIMKCEPDTSSFIQQALLGRLCRGKLLVYLSSLQTLSTAVYIQNFRFYFVIWDFGIKNTTTDVNETTFCTCVAFSILITAHEHWVEIRCLNLVSIT